MLICVQVNIKYLPELEKNGLMFVGHDVEGQRMEILELKSQLLFRSFCRMMILKGYIYQ